MNKIARIHVNQHVIKANAKNGENNPIFTIKQGGSNTYAHNVKVKGEMELVYSPDKPLSCGAKVWIETRGDIVLDKSSDTKDLSPTKLIASPTSHLVKKIDVEMGIFLRKKQRKIQNKNKLSACLSR
tara:strand:- start:150 stop:530 length:381 start_codon:yes stop_codon:yes gene_type:complete